VTPKTLAEWLDYQQRVHPRSIELGLARVREVWQRLGAAAPARVVITVGGTNGKGSTVAFLEAMLVAMGKREFMVVRTVEAEPPRRLVNERVDGHRGGTSVFELEPEGAHATRVTLTSEVELSRLLAAVASAPIRSALEDQLRNLAALVAAGE